MEKNNLTRNFFTNGGFMWKNLDLLPLNKITYYHKNECQHKHGQYNSRVNEWQHKHGQYNSRVNEWQHKHGQYNSSVNEWQQTVKRWGLGSYWPL
jgi:hypothetical protein